MTDLTIVHAPSDITNLAYNLMQKHGLISLGWTFSFNNRKKGFGLCHYGKKTIYLSRYFALREDISVSEQTLLHEIAHALVGRGHGHDRLWELKFVSIGGKNPSCCRVTQVENPQGKFIAKCSTCGAEYHRYRSSKHIHKTYLCGVCRSRINFVQTVV